MTTAIRLFKTGGTGKSRLARFAPSLHETGLSLNGSKEHWVAGFNECEIIDNDIAETSDYDKILKLYYNGDGSHFLGYYYFDTVSKPYFLEMRLVLTSDDTTASGTTDIAFTNNQFQLTFKFSDNHIYVTQTSEDLGAFTPGSLITLRWEAYNDADNNDKVDLYIDNVLTKTYDVDYEGYNYVAFSLGCQSGKYNKTYIYLIEVSNDEQFSTIRREVKFTEITDYIKRVENFVRRLDQPTSCDFILHDPHHSLFNTYKDERNEDIIMLLYDQDTYLTTWRFIGKIQKPTFKAEECTLHCFHPAKFYLSKVISSINGELASALVSSVAATVLTAVTDKEESPGWTADELIGKALILEEGNASFAATLYPSSCSEETVAGGAITVDHKRDDGLQALSTIGGSYYASHATQFCTVLEFPATSDPNYLDIEVVATFHGTNNATGHKIEIYNFTTSTWVELTEQAANTCETIIWRAPYKLVPTGTLSDYRDGVNDKIKIRFKWEATSYCGLYDGVIFMVRCNMLYRDPLTQNLHTITDNTSNTITCGASNFVTDNVAAGDKLMVIDQTSDIVKSVMRLSGNEEMFKFWDGIHSSQNSVPNSSVFTRTKLNHATLGAILEKMGTLDKTRWWFDDANTFHRTDSFSASGVTINEDDILNPFELEINTNEEELWNCVKYIHPSGVESDWKIDATSIINYGLKDKVETETIISNKEILNTMATNYVATHKDLEVLIPNCLIEHDDDVVIGETISFTAFGMSETLLVEGITYIVKVGKEPIQLMMLELGNAPLNKPKAEQLGDIINNMKTDEYQGLNVIDASIKDLVRGKYTEKTAFQIQGQDHETVKIWHDGTNGHIKDSTSHTKRMPIHVLVPEDGFTAGAANVYWAYSYGEIIVFGTGCYAVSYLRGSFIVPPNYKEGTNIIIRGFALAEGGAIANVDCQVYAGCRDSGTSRAWEMSAVTTAHSPDSLNASEITDFTVTLSDATCDFNPGDLVYFVISMDDNAAAREIRTWGWCFEYEVDEFD